MKVSKESVNYRPATNSKRCGNCEMLVAPINSNQARCSLVAGLIYKHDTCDKWQAKK